MSTKDNNDFENRPQEYYDRQASFSDDIQNENLRAEILEETNRVEEAKDVGGGYPNATSYNEQAQKPWQTGSNPPSAVGGYPNATSYNEQAQKPWQTGSNPPSAVGGYPNATAYNEQTQKPWQTGSNPPSAVGGYPNARAYNEQTQKPWQAGSNPPSAVGGYPNATTHSSKPKKKKKNRGGGFLISLLLIVALGLSIFNSVYLLSKDEYQHLNNPIQKAGPAEESKPVDYSKAKMTGDKTIISVVKEVMPSVVTIFTQSTVQDPFGRRSGSGSSGTGFIVSEKDNKFLIATNNHVVGNADNIKVTFNDNTTADAKVQGKDSQTDLALIYVQKSSLEKKTLEKIKVSKIGKSSELQIGEDVIAIGNALGYGQSVTRGIVSALNRGRGMTESDLPFIQTDAAINPGNSGGPLVNAKGEIVGINTIKIASNKIEGMGYAIPSDEFVPELNYISKDASEKAQRTYLGIVGQPVPENFQKIYKWPKGVHINEVQDDSPAQKAGLSQGDIITKFGDKEVSSVQSISRAMRDKKPGDVVECEVYRSNEGTRKVEIKLEKRVENGRIND